MMTLEALKNTYYKNLGAIYPKSEIVSIFRLLVKNRLHLDSADLILERENELNSTDLKYFQNSLKRLQKSEPIQYILGVSFFYNLEFKVNKEVLIPRPETEELVDWIIHDADTYFPNRKIRILDIGTGSGCIAVSLAKNLVNAEVWAIDISKKALDIAKDNAINNKVTIQFLQANILKKDSLPHRFDIIVSNPPYVRLQERKQMHGNVLQYEPDQALYVLDANPLVFYKKISGLAKKYLKENGKLYFEINQYLGAKIVQLVDEMDFQSVLKKDFLGKERMLRVSKDF